MVMFFLMAASMIFFWPIYSFADESVPDLKGQWKGTAQSVGHNKRAQHTEPLDEVKYRSVEFTLTIDVQKGCAFQGVKASKRGSEDFVGVINPTDKSIGLAENDGYYIGKLVSPDKMELIYMEAGPESRVAALEVFERLR